MAKWALRMLVILTLMGLSSMALTGVGYEGIEGLSVIFIHMVWAGIAHHYSSRTT